MKLIDKSALVAEIEKRLKAQNKDRDFNYLQIKELEAILSFLDTLEVKVVDLENEIDFVKDAYYYFTSDERDSMMKVARHFYELGLKTQKGE